MRLSVRLRDLFGFGHVHLDGPLRSSSFFFLDRRRLQFLRHFPGLKTQEISYFFLQKRPRLGYIFPHFATCTSILDLACSSGSFSTSGKRSSPRSRMWYLYCVERKCRKSSSADHKKIHICMLTASPCPPAAGTDSTLRSRTNSESRLMPQSPSTGCSFYCMRENDVELLIASCKKYTVTASFWRLPRFASWRGWRTGRKFRPHVRRRGHPT